MRIRLSTIYILIPVVFSIFLIVKIWQENREEYEDVEKNAWQTSSGRSQVVSFVEKSTKSRIQQQSECTCQSSTSGKLFDFCYKLPENQLTTGKRFSCEFADFWQRFEGENVKYLSVKHDQIPEPTFITAFSSDFTSNAVRMIGSIRELGIRNKVVVYDLGLKEGDKKRFKTACNVEIREFNFTKFPESMKNLRQYRWKPIVIAEGLLEFGAIWYLDTSVIIEKQNLSHIYDLINCQKNVDDRPPVLPIKLRDLREKSEAHEDGWNRDTWHRNLRECRKSEYLLHGYSGHGIWSVTHPQVYQYFPTNFEELKKEKAKMYDAGFVYAVNTKQVMMGIVKWYVLCALEDNCMGPPDATLDCKFDKNDRFSIYANCHRYDQSIINILLANANYYDRHYYASEIVDFFKIQRSTHPRGKNQQMLCID